MGTTRIFFTREGAFNVYELGDGKYFAEVPYWSNLYLKQLTPKEGIIIEARGWPARAFLCRFEYSDSIDAYIPLDGIHVSNHKYTFPNGPETSPPPIVLPLIPIWRGFFINTIFYTAIVLILWSSSFASRRMIRRKRGLCIKCVYDLRGDISTGCPECGWGRDEVEA